MYLCNNDINMIFDSYCSLSFAWLLAGEEQSPRHLDGLARLMYSNVIILS